jgi:Putative Flp pilus-assembly TadE/G-like
VLIKVARRRLRGDEGQVLVLSAVLLPLFLLIGGIVVTVGSWHTHGRKLQTKADAAAFAGGDVWQFPCVETATPPALTSSQKIEAAARTYVGPHTKADGTLYSATTFNAQVGKVEGNKIHVVLNGSNYWSDGGSPADYSDGTTSICSSEHLDVRATEDDSPNLFGLPLFDADIERKARVEIHEIVGLNGLLPIAVRVPKPVSAEAVFYNETSGSILAVKYFCELQTPPAGFNAPGGLGAWTTYDTSDPKCSYTTWGAVNVRDHTGVAIATSFRPRCDATATPPITTNCLSDNFTDVTSLCRQGSGRIAQCFYATGTGSTQAPISGLQYIRGFTNRTVTNGGSAPTFWSTPPVINGAYLDSPSANCGGSFTATSAYFNDPSDPCTAALHVNIDFGDALDPVKHPGAGAQVKYGQVYGTIAPNGEENCVPSGNSFTGGNHKPNCDMTVSGSGASGSVSLDPHFDNQSDPQGTRHAFVVMIQLKKTTIRVGSTNVTCGNTYGATCEWYYWDDSGPQNQGSWPTKTSDIDNLVFDNPLQRSFTGNADTTGPIRWLRIVADSDCNGAADRIDGDAASQTLGSHCFYMDMGLTGSIAQDQSESPFGFNTKSSQSGAVDCDPALNQWKDETEQGCSPEYNANDFSHDPPCPWPDGTNRSWNQFDQLQGSVWQPSPWPPYTCNISGGPPAAGEVDKGLKGRLFSPLAEKILKDYSTGEKAKTCPGDSATDFVPGRNYWSDSNNASGGTYAFAKQGVHPNNLRQDDPRLVNLFMSPYDAFTGSGGGVYPIASFGSFYITGWGTLTGGNIKIDDPCPGNALPPDLVNVKGNSGAEFIWGHFINYVVPPASARASEKICAPAASFMPCVPVLTQ